MKKTSVFLKVFCLVILDHIDAAMVLGDDNFTSDGCKPIHAQGHGVNLVCCSRESPLSSDCQFRPLCRTSFCRCHVTVSANLQCYLSSALQKSAIWLDHASPPSQPFDCFSPGFPNPTADYAVTLTAFNASLTPLLLAGLTSYNVTSLDIDAVLPESFAKLNFSKHFPYLKTLNIKTPVEEPRVSIGDLYFLIGNLRHLQHLTLFDVGFTFGKEPLWLYSLTRLHIEGSDIDELPKWLSFAKNLKKLTIRKTRLHSALVISQLKALTSLHLESNQIGDLHGILFNSKNVTEISLRSNLIGSIGSHTFLQCEALRILDLSDNKITLLPPKPFQLNSKLKILNLGFNEIQELQLHHFIGLETLRTLILSNNPLKGIEPFAFLPLSKSLRTLELESCNLTRLPLAITQCCLLENLEISDNRLSEADSMPPEILALIAEVKHIGFERNPLMKLPEGLFLIPTTNEATLGHILDTLIQLPVWSKQPCIPYLWRIHVSNSSSALQRKVAVWDKNRMRKENLKHCEFLYEKIMENLLLYRELAENSGCEANRRLRRVRESCKVQKDRKLLPKSKVEKPATSPSGVVVVEKPIRAGVTLPEHDLVLISSLFANVLFTIVFVSLVLYIIGSRTVGTVKTRKGFEEIDG